MSHTVSSVARSAGITVRTLHHYDTIGLLVPSGRSAAGYRLYEQGDLERLQEILFFRELGMRLDEIQRVMADAKHDRLEVLRSQRERLQARERRLQAVIEAVDRAIDAEEKGAVMSKDEMHEMLEVFDGFDPSEHEEEVKQRWGKSDAFKEAGRRTKRYKKEDWARIKAEEQAIAEELAAVMSSGLDPASDRAADVAERHRQHIDSSYYPCSTEMHVALGDMYVADPRFTEYWEKIAPGLAEFVQEAIATNALRS